MTSRSAAFATLLALALASASRVAGAAPSADPARSMASADGGEARADAMTLPELERLLEPLASEDVEARRSAARTVAGVGENALPAITKKLDVLRHTTSPQVGALVREATKGGSGDADLCALLAQTRNDGPAWVTAIDTAAVLRGLAHIGTTPALRQLVKVGGDHGSAFRPELVRIFRLLGDKVVPALIETKGTELRQWAYAQLESMGKRMPGDAVQTKDNQVLADVLLAYARVHEMDAVPVILSFVSSDRIQVRAAARDAVAVYGQDAIWKLREAYSNLTGKSAPDAWNAETVARELFGAYDRLRLQEVYGLFDEGLAKEKQGDLPGAIAAFDKVLAREPMLDRRAEAAPAYVAYAQSIEESDPLKALASLRKAARLSPDGPRMGRIEAEIAYLEGKDLEARGIEDAEPFRRALTLDPTHENARAELRRLESDEERRSDRFRNFAAAGAALVVALLGVVLFGGRRRTRARA